MPVLSRRNSRPSCSGLRFRHESRYVHVIRHEAVPEDGEPIKLRILPQQLNISEAIHIARENDLSRIPPLRNMMGNVDDHNARQPSHGMKITEIIQSADHQLL